MGPARGVHEERVAEVDVSRTPGCEHGVVVERCRSVDAGQERDAFTVDLLSQCTCDVTVGAGLDTRRGVELGDVGEQHQEQQRSARATRS